MHHKTNFLYLFVMISISTTYTADVDVGTNATTRVLLLESDLKPVYTYFN